MPKPLLPPRGIFVPTGLAFDKELSASVRDTAVQLLALAWGDNETPQLSISQLEQITGKGQSTLYEHMRTLRDRGALRWRSAGDAGLIVTFSLDSIYGFLEKLVNVDSSTDTNINILSLSGFSESEIPHNTPTSKRVKKARNDTCPAEWMDKLYGLCKQDKALASAGMRKRISDTGKVLIKKGVPLADLDKFCKKWYTVWPGNTGQPPKPEDIRNRWCELIGESVHPLAEVDTLSPEDAARLFDPRL